MSKVLVMVTTDDAGDEGGYNGNVIGALDGIMEGPFSLEAAKEYIMSNWCDGERIDYDNGEFTIEASVPHPNDSDYEAMLDAGGEVYHFKQI